MGIQRFGNMALTGYGSNARPDGSYFYIDGDCRVSMWSPLGCECSDSVIAFFSHSEAFAQGVAHLSSCKAVENAKSKEPWQAWCARCRQPFGPEESQLRVLFGHADANCTRCDPEGCGENRVQPALNSYGKASPQEMLHILEEALESGADGIIDYIQQINDEPDAAERRKSIPEFRKYIRHIESENDGYRSFWDKRCDTVELSSASVAAAGAEAENSGTQSNLGLATRRRQKKAERLDEPKSPSNDQQVEELNREGAALTKKMKRVMQEEGCLSETYKRLRAEANKKE